MVLPTHMGVGINSRGIEVDVREKFLNVLLTCDLLKVKLSIRFETDYEPHPWSSQARTRVKLA
jgi:hypothetical protein